MSEMQQTDREAVNRVAVIALGQGDSELAMRLLQLVGGSSSPTRVPTGERKARGRGEKRDKADLEKLVAKVRNVIADNADGVSVSDINKVLGTTTREVALPIKKLIGDGLVRTKGEKRGTTYHLTAKGKQEEK